MNAHRTVLAALFSAALFSSAAGTSFAAAPDAQSAQLISQARTALGGSAIDGIKVLETHVKTNAAGLSGTGTQWSEIGGVRFAEQASNPPIVGGDGYDGTDVWNSDGSGLVWVDGGQAGRAQEITSAYLSNYALFTPNAGGAAVTWGGPQTSGGKTYDVLNVTAPGSAVPFAMWFDQTTHLPVRVTFAIGPTTFTTTMSDYRPIKGLMYPYVSHNESSDGNTSDSVVTSAIANPDDGPSHLVKPVSNVHDFSIAGGASQTTIPFDLVENHVYLNVMLNGKGPFRFIFDTGGANIIDPAVALAVGAAGKGSIQGGGVGAQTESFSFANVANMQIGGATVKNQLFGVVPTRMGFGMSGGESVDGLIGFEVLSRFVTTFDYQNNRVILTMPGNVAPPAGSDVVPIVQDGRQPQFACKIDAVAGDCTLDTGSRAAISLFAPFMAAHPEIVPQQLSAPGVNGFGIGGPAMGRLGRLQSFGVGTFTIPNVIGDFTTQDKGAFAEPFIAANVGGDILKRFNMTLDYTKLTMALTPNASFNAPDTYDRSGLFLLNRAGTIVVYEARPGTPAAQAGIVKGDTITSLDGKPVAGMTLGAVRQTFFQPAGTVVQIGLTAKDGTTRTIALTLKDFV